MDYRKKQDESINFQKKISRAFPKNGPSFLCASSNERDSEKLRTVEFEKKYKLKIREYKELNNRKLEAMIAGSKEKLVTERGITLLALIITVVIMIILAAVTINVTLGDGGLVDQAKWAAEQTANSTKAEQEQLANVSSQINDIIAGIGSGGSDTNSTGGEDTNSVDTNSVDTNSVEDTNTIDTNTIEPEPDPIPDGTITIGDPQWQPDGTANVSVTSSEGSYIIQYQINGTDEDGWQTVQGGVVTGVKHGDTAYARITDGEQYSNPQNKKIEDLAAPEKANIEVTPANVLVGESLTAKVTHVDNETGVDIENSKWVMNQSSSEIGTDDTGAYTGKFTTNGETITLDSSTAGTYYLHVLTTDLAGNKTETVSEVITISGITGTVTQSGDVTWSAGQASISLTTTESQYTIVYKINEEGSWQTYNGTSITGLSHGDKVTACLTNASQTTFGPEETFEIKDETDPTVTVTAQGSPSTSSITVTAQAVDNETGMVASPTYTFQYKQNGQGSYTTPSDASDISNATYTFTGLTQGTTYDIQVIVNGDNAGNAGTGTTQATTQTVPGADEGLQTGDIIASGASWSGGKASTTLTTTTSFQIQYQVNGTSESSWSAAADSPVTVSNLNHGDTVYARLWDGNNGGSYASITILDGIDPTVSVTVGTITETSIAVSVSASDGQSGLATSGIYKYYLDNDLKQTTENTSYTYEGLTGGTQYTIKVEAYDKAGRKGIDTKQATTEEASIPESETQVANYADVDGNGTVDGVIYADLAIGGSGSGLGQSYTIPTSSNFKKYKVTQESYSGSFGTGKVIAPVDPNSSSETERFYVMALSDAASSSISTKFWSGTTSVVTSTDFGTGEANTTAMMSKPGSSSYLWGKITSQVADGWYVPSRDEWAAFSGELGITGSTYSSKGLSDRYWSSSQSSTTYVWIPRIDFDTFAGIAVSGNGNVRLGTTF